jgi:polyphosphate glucokinase
MEKLFWPDLFIVGGGISKQSEKYIPLLRSKHPSSLRNS